MNIIKIIANDLAWSRGERKVGTSFRLNKSIWMFLTRPITLLISLSLSFFSYSAGEDFILQQLCSKGDFSACENLAAFYIKNSNWDNAYMLGQVLCKNQYVKGCTFAGTAQLAQGKVEKGIEFLNKSCDGLEPYSCRSLARLMKKKKDFISAYMYFKRACYYGNNGSCKTMKIPGENYSQKGKDFLKKAIDDCDNPKSNACQSTLSGLAKCHQILTANDCLLIPGELSIYFRAKLFQESAKNELINIAKYEKALKLNLKLNRFSYDLNFLLQGQRIKNFNGYVYGFLKKCTIKFEASRKAESTSLAIYKSEYLDLSGQARKNILAFFSQQSADSCYDPKFGHEAFAVANLDPLNPSKLDIWKINSDGNILQIRNGLPMPSY